MKSKMQRLGDFPLVFPLAVVLMFASYAAAGGLGLAWVLRVLEIHSIFDRWLTATPGTCSGSSQA